MSSMKHDVAAATPGRVNALEIEKVLEDAPPNPADLALLLEHVLQYLLVANGCGEFQARKATIFGALCTKQTRRGPAGSKG